jgi:hypothetical protein
MQTSNTQHVWNPRAGTAPSPFSNGYQRYTAEQSLFLRRLQDLLEKRRQYADRLAPADWRRRLIDKALYSTYLDCLNLKVADEARDILRPATEVASD